MYLLSKIKLVSPVYRSQSWTEAVKWYSTALEASPTDLNELDESAVDEPDYKIQAKMAAMYSQGEWRVGNV